MKLELNEGQHNFVDVALKAIGGLLAIIAFFIGLNQFKITKEREYELEFYKNEIQVMNKIVEITSNLATYPTDSIKFRQAYLELLEMRNGKQYLFTEREIDDLLGEFYSMTETYRTHSPAYTQGDLQSKSYDIAIACKKRIDELKQIK
jgi:hypothetical protein